VIRTGFELVTHSYNLADYLINQDWREFRNPRKTENYQSENDIPLGFTESINEYTISDEYWKELEKFYNL
jgi:hypothetical protein